MAGYLLAWIILSIVNGVILLVAIRIVAPSCERNTLSITFGVATLLTGAYLIPLYGWILAIGLLYLISVKLYDLGIGQAFMILVFLVAANFGFGALLAAIIAS